MFEGTVYIAAPRGCVSGGPELCHQFLNMLAKLGYSAAICYYDEKGIFGEHEIPEVYKKYNVHTEVDFQKVNQPQNLLVMTENMYNFFELYDFKCRIVYWWMSVDNFFGIVPDYAKGDMRSEYFDVFREDSMIHLVQSAYARDFVKNEVGVSERNIMNLSDYISDAFRNGERVPISLKKDWIAYNPKKGFAVLNPIIEKYPQFEWVPLLDMTPDMVALTLQVAKVYVDFGNHPGKDRIPREAVMSGACVITNKCGSAAFYEDVPIAEQYKFTNPSEQIEEFVSLIQDIFENYTTHRKNFDAYREWIQKEKVVFEEEVLSLMKRIEE